MSSHGGEVYAVKFSCGFLLLYFQSTILSEAVCQSSVVTEPPFSRADI